MISAGAGGLHGGKGNGAPEGNRNAWKHGARSAETREALALIRDMARLLDGKIVRT